VKCTGTKFGGVKMMRIVKKVFMLSVVVFVVLVLTSFFVRTELYSTTSRYQLKNDLDAGNEMAIEYYEDMYTSRGIYLFDEE
jgi:hypothetical protein